MKIVIDIPNEVLKSRHYCQYFGAWSTKLTETIENGTPYGERPQGEWKVYGRQGGIPITDYCTNCKYEMMWYKNKYNFCPNCGADMRKGSAE